MKKAIVVYLVILVLMVIASLYLAGTGFFTPGKVTPITMSTISQQPGSTTTVSSSAPSSSTTTVAIPTTTVYFASCQSKSATAAILNGYFSTGNYYGWNASGLGFGATPLNIIYANNNSISGYYGAPWAGYPGQFFATTYHGGLSLQVGNLTSNVFQVTEPYLNFKVISPQSNLLYVEILNRNKPAIIVHYNTYVLANATNVFANASIPLTTLMCQNVSIRVVAGVTGPAQNLNYIAVGGFYMGTSAVSTPAISSISFVSS